MTVAHPPSTIPPIGSVMVVDDHEPNRTLLREILELNGHRVVECTGGDEALAEVGRSPPDLVLLDVNMPGLSGLEVCRRLRADPVTASLPVILVTSLTHREQRLEGIAAGANDYLTKPIDRSDLLLRVTNALHLRALHRTLDAQYQHLREVENLRDSLVQLLVHDLRSPLTGIMAYLDLIRGDAMELSHPTLLTDIEEMGRNVRQMAEMVSTVLDVSRLESAAMPIHLVSVDLGALAADVILSLGGGQRVPIDLAAPPEPVFADADPELIGRVLANLVGNAIKFTPREGRVGIEVRMTAAGPEARVSDTGPGIAPEYHAKVFEKFGQVSQGAMRSPRSSGLGLTFCKLALEAHGGTIGLESEIDRGSTFWFRLPPAH